MTPSISAAVRFERFARWILIATLGVILWGAFVRASGSGAGCGAHWPACNGEVIPRSPSVETLIEFTHRVTSGLAFWGVVALLWGAFRVLPPRHPGRRAAAWSLFFMVTEALIGAGLVLLEHVAHDTRPMRGVWMAVHLLNTFLLLGSLTSTWWHARRAARLSPVPPELSTEGSHAVSALNPDGLRLRWASWLALLGLLVLGISGAVAALGDTLFPAPSLAHGLRHDFSPGAHVLVRLRVLHPAIAVGVGAGLLWFASFAAGVRPVPTVRRTATFLAWGVALQLCAGVLNVILLAPIWMQLLHLLLADALWMTLWVLRLELAAQPQEASPKIPGTHPDSTLASPAKA